MLQIWSPEASCPFLLSLIFQRAVRILPNVWGLPHKSSTVTLLLTTSDTERRKSPDTAGTGLTSSIRLKSH
jgi:hypothetical protein